MNRVEHLIGENRRVGNIMTNEGVIQLDKLTQHHHQIIMVKKKNRNFRTMNKNSIRRGGKIHTKII